MNRLNLLNFNVNDLEKKIFFKNKFIYNQIIYWIYKKFCFNFKYMTNISINIRNILNKMFKIDLPKVVSFKKSIDSSIKWWFNVNDDIIETVYIPSFGRSTLCISTQVGCAMKCKFCSTSKGEFKRNLSVGEIIGQILFVCYFLYKNKMKCITNIVIMGMGEPLLNFYNVVNSVKIMLDKKFFGFSKRKIVLSTSGIVPFIYKLYNYIDIVLVISLHSSNNSIRNKIMPVNKKYDIISLLRAAFFYVKNTKASKNKINIEYLMLNNVNDDVINAYELLNLLKNFPSKVNLIPFNYINNSCFSRSSKKKMLLFLNILNKNGIFTSIRNNRGLDINASCGQLSGDLN